MKFFDKLTNIYEHLADEQSKDFFRAKAMTAISGDKKYFCEFRDNMIENQIILAKKDIEINNLNNAYIFGCGDSSSFAFRLYGKNIVAFSDNNKKRWGGKHFKLPIIPPTEIPKTSKVIVSPRSKIAYTDIKNQLRSYGFNEENIYIFTEICEKIYGKEYLGIDDLTKDLIPNDEEIFVDAGCFDGGTSLEFIDFAKGDFKKIYAFEPDPISFKKCEKNLSKFIENGKCKVYNYALNDKNETVHFLNKATPGSRIDEAGILIKSVALDDILKDEKVTFIKMDIEGGEYNALIGAKNIIAKNHPKLAICIYHKPEDIFELPNLILEIDSTYKFYIRHYSYSDVSSVLYAI